MQKPTTWLDYLKLPYKYEKQLENLEKTGKSLNDLSMFIDNINQESLAPLTRFAVMEKLCFSTLMREQFLQARCLSADTLQANPERKAFLRHLVSSYNMIVAEMLERDLLRQQTENLATTLERSIFFFGELLIEHYQFHKVPPDRIWYGMHQFYAYSEIQNLHNIPIISLYSGNKNTLTHSYKVILLTALVDPYRLQKGEIRCLYDYLYHWQAGIDLVRIIKPQEAQQTLSYLIDLESDDKVQQVHYVNTKKALLASQQSRLLDLQAFLDALEAHIDTLKQQSAPAYENKSMGFSGEKCVLLLSKVLDLLKKQGERNSARKSLANCNFDVIIGFPNISQHIQLGFDTGATSINLLNLRQHVQAQDVSSGGTCLLIGNNSLSDSHSRLFINQIILVNTNTVPSNPPIWRLGFVRWLQDLDEDAFRFGVEYISGSPIMAQISIEEFSYLRRAAMVILQPKDNRQEQFLFAPAGTFKPKRRFFLNTGLREFYIEADKLLHSESDYEHLTFNLLKDKKLNEGK